MKEINIIKNEIEEYLREGINFNNILNNAYLEDEKKDQLISLLQLNSIKEIGVKDMKDPKLDENPKITLFYPANDDQNSSDPNKEYSYVSDFIYIGKVWYEYDVWKDKSILNHFVKEIEICGSIDLKIRTTFNRPAWCEILTKKAKLIGYSNA